MTPPQTAEQINGPQVGQAYATYGLPAKLAPLSRIEELEKLVSNLRRDLAISHQQLSEAQKDKERLDWMDKNMTYFRMRLWMRRPTIRESIDAAREREGK